jgi:hypothetical protein
MTTAATWTRSSALFELTAGAAMMWEMRMQRRRAQAGTLPAKEVEKPW